MWKYTGPLALTAVLGTGLFVSFRSAGQTPEQMQTWETQRLQALADERSKVERLARDREARKADPMAWVRTLNPMTAGGWEFRAVANDGSWAAFSTHHQMKRSGQLVTVWLRQEYAEPQVGSSGKYSSVVEKVQYDCDKEQARTLLIVYYADNNIQGTEQSEEADPKTAAWSAIVPGTRDEFNFLWACSSGKAAGTR
ncbi:MAG TPA: surface-adhesin E family protein [Steroidobacteraceae bacterium]|nr:surface-adhesin E family protein [Steroidobacteraceae bacterium]